MNFSEETTPILKPSNFEAQLNTIKQQLLELENQLNRLQDIILNPPCLTITGIEHLPLESGQDWKDKIHDLFYNARIPMFWILDTHEINLGTDNINTVKVTFINFIVKEHVASTLLSYLEHHYQNNIYIY